MKKRLLPVIFLTFVNVLNFAILIPVTPFIVKQYGGGAIMYGLMLSIYPLFQFFATPVLGAWSDRYGRRNILMLSQLGTLISWLVFIVAYYVPVLHIGAFSLPIIIIMLARAVDGITGGNNSVANAYVADITEPDERTKVFGMMGGVVGIGLIIGPVLGGFAGDWGIGYLGPALLAMAISCFAIACMYFWLPESLTEEHRVKELHFNFMDEFKFVRKVRKFTVDLHIKYLFFIRIFFLFVFSAYSSIIILYMIDYFYLTQKQVGLFFLVVGVFLILNQMFVARFMAKKFGELRTFMLGQIAIMIAFSGIMWAPSFWVYVVFVYLNNFGFSISFPTYRSLMTRNVERSQQGEINGIDESFLAATSAVAPLAAGYIYHSLGRYTFGIMALILACAFAVFVLKYQAYRQGRVATGTIT